MSKRSWLCFIRRLFFPETTHHKQQHKRNNGRRWLFGRLRKNKGRLPTLEPPPSPSVEKPRPEAEEKQSTCEEDAQELAPQYEVEEPKSFVSSVTNESQGLPLNHHHENHDKVLAAIKIQTFYRGYLARKALRALKGFVILQAIIRGRAVRRQAMTTLKCLQAIVNIQSEVCTRRSEMIHTNNTDLQLHHLRDDNPKMESNRRTRLDDGLLTKEEEIDDDIILRKKEAILRRHRSKAYSFNHRHSTDSEDGKTEGRLRYWLAQYVNDQALKNGDKFETKQLKLKNIESLNDPQTIYMPRRSFHKYRKQVAYIEDGLNPSSPTSIPTYMAATESTKAKTRSTSSPRLRPMHFEAYSDGDSPYKHKISPMSSINSELTCLSKVSGKSFCSLQQKSPSFKGLPCPIISSRNFKDVNLDSEGLLVNKGSR